MRAVPAGHGALFAGNTVRGPRTSDPICVAGIGSDGRVLGWCILPARRRVGFSGASWVLEMPLGYVAFLPRSLRLWRESEVAVPKAANIPV